ncbi:hypothetical protein CICLE_v10023092mg [Citrus x clementina]|uniref:Uncharacterized protein n=1 Tax=Citrus clementina TaxID=85681 RepID=V4U3F4_CITCL|nr:hypothetical protein CICLE_v10023092mg [Citrus x clementina]
MVLNSSVVLTIANVSANVCQYIACNPERLPVDQVLHLLCCLPLRHLRRLAFSFWAFLCYSDNISWSSDHDSDTDTDSDSDRRHSHSD